jgi:quercetin dioxygenase-like cupin family protein
MTRSWRRIHIRDRSSTWCSKAAWELTIGSKVLTLNEGDSIYFDSTQPHCMRALNEEPVRFLAIIF